jgi:hypothetical protein
MKNKDQSDIKEMQEQLNDIRNVLNISSSTFRLLYSADNFRTFFLLTGVFSLLMPALYQALLFVYNSHSAIPNFMMITFYALIGVCWLILMYVRTKASIDEARRLNISSNIFVIFKQLLSTKMWLAIVPMLLVFIGLQISLSSAFALTQYIPYYGMVVGLMLTFIGIMIHENEYCYAGMWMILLGAVLFFFLPLPMHITYALVFAPGCFLFVLSNKRTGENDEVI